MTVANTIQGQGRARPFTRDRKTGVALASGDDLINDEICAVLSTPLGSVRWNPLFGSRMNELRHLNSDEDVQNLGRAFAVEALRQWMPSVTVATFTCTVQTIRPGADKLFVNLTWVPTARSGMSGAVAQPVPLAFSF